jgi:hypothetical protein
VLKRGKRNPYTDGSSTVPTIGQRKMRARE